MRDEATGKVTAPEVGCVFDGHRGQYIYGDIIKLAMRAGFEISHEDRGQLNEDGWRMSDLAVHLSEQAETYLNDHVAEAGHWFGWSDGEYFYQAAAWWEDES